MDSDPICYTIVRQNERPFSNSTELAANIEKGGEKNQINAIDQTLRLMLSGEPATKLTIPIIRFAAPTKNKTLKKYLLLYYEICPKTSPDGKLRQEMVLLCNNLLNDLSHPNEYIRGCTLHFLAKVNEKEILEPLITSILCCLEHRHSYVRKNAILAIHHIFVKDNSLIPEAVEIVYNSLLKETDDSCKKNSLLMLQDTDPSLVIKYLHTVADKLTTFDETLQCTIAESIRHFKTKRLSEKSFLIDCLKRLLLSTHESVRYEAAGAIISLGPESVASAKLAISCYVELLKNGIDNSTKLILLSQIEHTLQINPGALSDSLMDVLSAEDNTESEISEKIIKLILHSTTSSNVENVIKLFGSELCKPSNRVAEEEVKFKHMIIGAIMFCAMKFSSTRLKAVKLLIDTMYFTSLGYFVNLTAHIQKIASTGPDIQKEVGGLLLSNLEGECRLFVATGSVWMIGEYVKDAEAIDRAFDSLMTFLENTEFLDSGYTGDAIFVSLNPQKLKTLNASLLYERDIKSLCQASNSTNDLNVSESYASGCINDKKWHFIAVTASTLSKLYVNYKAHQPPESKLNLARAKMIIILSRLMKKLKEYPSYATDKYVYDRVMYAIKFMEKETANSDEAKDMEHVILSDIKYAVDSETCCNIVLPASTAPDKDITYKGIKKPLKPMRLRLLKKSAFGVAGEHHDEDLDESLGVGKYAWAKRTSMNVGRTISLTGLSDPVYVEVNVVIVGYNCVLDVFVFNQTLITLQNVTLEFSSQGNLIEVTRVPEFGLRPQGFHCVKATAKVASTNLGVITGTVMYSTSTSTDVSVINLDKVFINMAEFIRPATCTLVEFQRMWYNFEWENKINIETGMRDLYSYLKGFIDVTRMKCLSSDNGIADEYGFLSANLYAKSIFGEDFLVNISADEDKSGYIKGNVRIRSQTQGVAISLGDIVNNFHSANKLNTGSV